jgi:transposase
MDRQVPSTILWKGSPRCWSSASSSRWSWWLGLLEKTDRIDAQVIVRFAEVKKCEPSVPASAEQQCLKALSRRLQQLSRLAADQKNQRHLVDEPRVLRTFDAALKVAKKQMREVEAEIATLLASDPLWQ